MCGVHSYPPLGQENEVTTRIVQVDHELESVGFLISFARVIKEEFYVVPALRKRLVQRRVREIGDDLFALTLVPETCRIMMVIGLPVSFTQETVCPSLILER